MPLNWAAWQKSRSVSDADAESEENIASEVLVEKAAPGLAKTFSMVALFTLFSKFAGLARDIIINKALGLGLVQDAYNYAYSITGTILVLFGGQGGPFHSATMTTLLPRKTDADSSKLVMQIMVWTGLLMALLSLVVYLLAPYLAHCLANGEVKGNELYTTHERWVEIVKQLRIMSPLIFVSSLVGIGCGISNTYNEHFWPSIAPAFASAAIIAFILWPHTDHGSALAMGTLVGGIGQLLVQLPGILKAKPQLFSDIFRKLQPGMKEYLVMVLPLTVSTSIGTLIGYVDQAFASNLEAGDWSAICNANRLVQLPLGILVTAMLVPIGPIFREQVLSGKIDGLKNKLRQALTLMWFLALPMSALLLVEGRQIIQLLFQRGEFTAHNTEMVLSVLIILVPMIFFYVARDLLTRVFYGFEDSQTPFRIGVMAIAIKYFLDWLFVTQWHYGTAGIAFATTLMTIINLCWLFYFLRKKIGKLGSYSMVKPVLVMFLGSLLCGFSAFNLVNIIPDSFINQRFFAHFLIAPHALTILAALKIGIASSAGILLYVGFCYALKLEELHLFANKIGAKLKPTKAPVSTERP